MPHPTPDSIWINPVHFLAFGFGSGALPIAPGTWGTLMAIPLYLLFAPANWLNYSLIVMIALIAGIYLCHRTAKDINVHDHSGIVWDEFVGYFITMFAVPVEWYWVILGFFIFRLFDIWKPWPIARLDRRVKGGLGIMLDDIIAGIYAWFLMQIFVFILFAVQYKG